MQLADFVEIYNLLKVKNPNLKKIGVLEVVGTELAELKADTLYFVRDYKDEVLGVLLPAPALLEKLKSAPKKVKSAPPKAKKEAVGQSTDSE